MRKCRAVGRSGKNGGPWGHSITIFCPFLTSYYLPLKCHFNEKGFLLLLKKSGGTIAPLPPIPTALKWEREKERQRELTWPRAASSSLAPNWWPFQKGECVRPCWRASITFLATYYLYLPIVASGLGVVKTDLGRKYWGENGVWFYLLEGCPKNK